MSELGEIHEKINGISDQLSHLKGWLEGIVPNLATKEDVTTKISIHQATHHGKSLAPAKLGGKFMAVIIGAIGALTATVIALTQLL